MIAAALLLAAAGSPSLGASVTAYATARVVRGERIALAAPIAGPDRLLRETLRMQPEGATKLRLVEFH